MNSITTIFAALLFTTLAHADGFVCTTEANDLTAKVFNNTSAEAGTRTAAVMVLSDPKIQMGRKTIAVFRGKNISSQGATYTGKVDHRFNETGRKGELIAGTKIKFLKKVILDVDFSYAQPMKEGETTTATLTLIKRDKTTKDMAMTCQRYLKN